MKLNKDKFVFEASKLMFLGHKKSEKRISPDSRKVKAIKDVLFSRPKRELQKLPTRITCDPCKFGISKNFEQKYENELHDVAFKSRSCTSVEKKLLSGKERETLDFSPV